MTKVMRINGMMCEHCVATVERVLQGIDGVIAAKVDLQNKTADIAMGKAIDDELLARTVTAAGYEVIGIE